MKYIYFPEEQELHVAFSRRHKWIFITKLKFCIISETPFLEKRPCTGNLGAGHSTGYFKDAANSVSGLNLRITPVSGDEGSLCSLFYCYSWCSLGAGSQAGQGCGMHPWPHPAPPSCFERQPRAPCSPQPARARESSTQTGEYEGGGAREGKAPRWLPALASYFVLTFEATRFSSAYTAEKPETDSSSIFNRAAPGLSLELDLRQLGYILWCTGSMIFKQSQLIFLQGRGENRAFH